MQLSLAGPETHTMSERHLNDGLLDRLRARHGARLGSDLASDIPGGNDQRTSAGSDSEGDLWDDTDEHLLHTSGPSSRPDEEPSSFFVPDTPSPVFSNKFRSTHRSHVHAPEQRDSKESTDNHKNTSRTSALNQLKKKRLQLKKKKDEDATESDSESGEDHHSKHQPCRNHIVLSGDDTDEDLPVAFNKKADNRRRSASVNAASSASGIATRSPATRKHAKNSVAISVSDDDSTDIDEDDLENFIDGLLAPSPPASGGQGRNCGAGDYVSSVFSKRKSRSPKSPDDYSYKRSRTQDDPGPSTSSSARADAESDGDDVIASLMFNPQNPGPSTSANAIVSDHSDSDDDVAASLLLPNRRTSRVESDDSVLILGEYKADEASRNNDFQQPSTSQSNMPSEPSKRPTENPASSQDRRPVPSTSRISQSGARRSNQEERSSAQSDIPGPRHSGASHGRHTVPMRAQLTSTPRGDAAFLPPPVVSPHRDGRTSTQTRVPGLRRRGNRTRVLSVSSPHSMLVSPQSRTNNQLAADEVMARRLQEELDREFASSLEAGSASRPHVTAPHLHTRHGHTAAEAPRLAGRSASARRLEEVLDRDVQFYMMLGGMTDEEFAQYEAVGHINGQRLDNATGPGVALRRTPAELNLVPPPARSGTRSTARTSAVTRARTTTTENLDYETMLARIGGMSEQEWSLHQAIYRNANDSTGDAQAALNDVLDPEVLHFMAHRDRRHAALNGIRGRQRGRRTRQRFGHDIGVNSFTENDYEELLSLAETLGDVKPRGLTDHQINMLPTKSYTADEVPEDGLKDCNICFAEYEEKETLRLLQCFHYFHDGCIDRWLKENASCPICRVEVKFE